MIVVLCLMCALMILSLTTLLAAAALKKSGDSRAELTVCRNMAGSLGRLLTEELCEEAETGLQLAFRTMLCEDRGLEHCRDESTGAEQWEYLLSETAGGCDLRLMVSWGDESAGFREMIGEILENNPEGEWNQREIFDGALLYLEIVCKKGAKQYRMESVFGITVREKEEGYEWKFMPVSQRVG